MLGAVGIVLAVKLRLQSVDFFVRHILQLCVDQSAGGVAQFHQLADTLGRCRIGVTFPHDRTLAVIDFIVLDRVAVIAHKRVGINVFGILAVFLLRGNLGFRQRGGQMLHGIVNLCFQQQFSEAVNRIGVYRLAGGRRTIRTGNHFHLAANHFGMLHKVAVHGDAVGIFRKVQPRLVLLAQDVTLLQEDDVRHNLCAAALERIVGQTHRADEVAALGHVLAGTVIFFVQCTTGGDEHHNAAGAQLVDAFDKEIVVNGKMQPVILRVVDLKIAERHIAHNAVKIVVGKMRTFVAGHLDIGLLVKLLRNAACNAVQFNAVEFGITAAKMSVRKKCACTHAGFKDFAALYTETLQRSVDGVDNGGGRVKGRQCAAAGSFVFGFGQYCFQSAVLICPRAFVRVKRIGQTAPAGILRQNLLFFLVGGYAAIGYALFNFFQLLDGGNVGVKLFARRCRQIIQIGGFIGNRFAVVRFIFCRKAFHICHNLRDKGAGFFDDLAIDGFNSFLRLRLLTWLFRGRPRCIFGVGRK